LERSDLPYAAAPDVDHCENAERHLEVISDYFQCMTMLMNTREDLRSLTEEIQCQLFDIVSKFLLLGTCGLRLDTPLTSADQSYVDELHALMGKLMLASEGNGGRAIVTTGLARTASLSALSDILSTTINPEHLDFASSMGQWVLHCLKSRVRDIRLAAARILRAYLRKSPKPETRRRNWVAAFNFVRSSSDSNEPSVHETCIYTLGMMMHAGPDEEAINLILYRFTHYLGDRNPFLWSLAYDELLKLSEHSSYRALRIFEPYWRTIAPTLVKDVPSQSSSLQRLCTLMGVCIPNFLKMTSIFTVPHLILMKQADVLYSIASACSENNEPTQESATVMDLCLSSEQLPGLLACLLMQPSSNPEAFVLSTLSSVSAELGNIDLHDLLKSDPVKIAYEVLRSAEDGGDSQTTQVQSKMPR